MKTLSEPIRIEKAFSPTIFTNLKYVITQSRFPWHWAPGTAYNKEVYSQIDPSMQEENSSFSHRIYADGAPESPLSPIIETAFITVLDSVGLKIKELLRVRVGLILKSNQRITHAPHVDYKERHYTALLYMTTCNAPTLLYNQTYNSDANMEIFDYYKLYVEHGLKIKYEIPSVENSLVIFDGHQFHSSTTPTDIERRIAININFTVND